MQSTTPSTLSGHFELENAPQTDISKELLSIKSKKGTLIHIVQLRTLQDQRIVKEETLYSIRRQTFSVLYTTSHKIWQAVQDRNIRPGFLTRLFVVGIACTASMLILSGSTEHRNTRWRTCKT